MAPVFADWTDYDYVWFEGWNKRQVLRVDQTTGAGANYELKVNVTWTEDYRSDFKDLRITYLNGTDLKWWIEQLVSDSFCALWLKIPVDLDSESFDCFWWSQNPIADTYYNSSATDVFKRVISSGVTLALPMNEGSGNTLIDYSGNGNNGVKTNGAWVTTGMYGTALSFADDGNIALTSTITFAGSFSVLWWMNRTDSVSYDFVWGNSGGTNKLGGNIGSGTLFARVLAGGSNDVTTVCSVGSWKQAVITRNSVDKVDSYIDGGIATRLFGNVAQTGNSVYTHLATDQAGVFPFKGVLGLCLAFSYELSSGERSDLYAYYPQCSSANLGSLFLRTYVSGGVSYGFIVMEDTSNMDYIYLIGLLGVIGVSLVLFKLKLGVVGLVWGIFGIAIAASLSGNQAVPFYPYLTLGVAVVGTLLVLYSGYEMRGA